MTILPVQGEKNTEDVFGGPAGMFLLSFSFSFSRLEKNGMPNIPRYLLTVKWDKFSRKLDEMKCKEKTRYGETAFKNLEINVIIGS